MPGHEQAADHAGDAYEIHADAEVEQCHGEVRSEVVEGEMESSVEI